MHILNVLLLFKQHLDSWRYLSLIAQSALIT